MSKSKYLMGVDVGTQSAKVVIFDLQGNIVCQGVQPLRPMEIPAPLLAEHPEGRSVGVFAGRLQTGYVPFQGRGA